jgi:hypothetical protein
MSDKKKLLDDFRVCIAEILNLGAAESSDESKIMLAQILQGDPGSLRLHVQLEPLTIIAAVFAPDRKTPPVELFRIIDVPKNEDFQ